MYRPSGAPLEGLQGAERQHRDGERGERAGGVLHQSDGTGEENKSDYSDSWYVLLSEVNLKEGQLGDHCSAAQLIGYFLLYIRVQFSSR